MFAAPKFFGRNDSVSCRSKATKLMVYTGVLAAVSIILYLFEIPLFFGYLKIDLGDLPAVIAGVMLGPWEAVAVELIKVIVGLVIKGTGSMGFGDLMNFIVGVALSVPFALVYRALSRRGAKTYIRLLAAGIAGMVSMVAIGVVGNYLIAPPFFKYVLNINLTSEVLWGEIGGATALNVMKSAISAVVMVPVVKFTENHPVRV